MAEQNVMQPLIETVDSQPSVLSPGVGYFFGGPSPGAFLTGGSFIGRLQILNTVYDLFLPDDLYGRVVMEEEQDYLVPVEYGGQLFRLQPDKDFAAGDADKPAGAGEEAVDLTGNGFVVAAFTTGIFYAKPSPDSPPFVSEGDEIEKGKALGLIEVMKTFNHIIFQGTDQSDRGTVKKVLVKDSQEVKLGQPLFIIE